VETGSRHRRIYCRTCRKYSVLLEIQREVVIEVSIENTWNPDRSRSLREYVPVKGLYIYFVKRSDSDRACLLSTNSSEELRCYFLAVAIGSDCQLWTKIESLNQLVINRRWKTPKNLRA